MWLLSVIAELLVLTALYAVIFFVVSQGSWASLTVTDYLKICIFAFVLFIIGAGYIVSVIVVHWLKRWMNSLASSLALTLLFCVHLVYLSVLPRDFTDAALIPGAIATFGVSYLNSKSKHLWNKFKVPKDD
jgi:hypothetical protein